MYFLMSAPSYNLCAETQLPAPPSMIHVMSISWPSRRTSPYASRASRSPIGKKDGRNTIPCGLELKIRILVEKQPWTRSQFWRDLPSYSSRIEDCRDLQWEDTLEGERTRYCWRAKQGQCRDPHLLHSHVSAPDHRCPHLKIGGVARVIFRMVRAQLTSREARRKDPWTVFPLSNTDMDLQRACWGVT